MSRLAAPGPTIFTSRISSSVPLVSSMLGATESSNVMVLLPSLLHASAMAWRRLPAPLSAVVVTTGFAVHAVMSCETVLLVLGSWFVPPRYSAVMLRVPVARVDVVTCAVQVLPPASLHATGAADVAAVVLELHCTVGRQARPSAGVTVAVKVTSACCSAGFSDEISVVVVS